MDPDQKLADLDLQCFHNRINLVSAGHWLNPDKLQAEILT